MQLHKLPSVKLILQVVHKGDAYGYVHVRVGVPGTKRYILKSLGHKIPVDRWNADAEAVSGPEGRRINALTAAYLEELTQTLDNAYKQGVRFSAEEVRGLLNPRGEQIDFMVLWQQRIEHAKLDNQQSTIRSVARSYESFKEFAGDTVAYSTITAAFLTRYRASLMSAVKPNTALAGNTVFLRFRHLKEAISGAMDRRLLSPQQLDGFKWPKYKAPTKVYLTLEQTEAVWQKVENGGFDDDANLLQVAVYFTLACYSGLRFSDWGRFTTEKLIETEALRVATRKTGEPVYLFFDTFKRLEKVVRYIQKRNMRFTLTEPKANSTLKRVADRCGINMKLTTHIGRHTFGTLLAALGYTTREIADCMSISEITAQVYAKNTRQGSRAAQVRNGGL